MTLKAVPATCLHQIAALSGLLPSCRSNAELANRDTPAVPLLVTLKGRPSGKNRRESIFSKLDELYNGSSGRPVSHYSIDQKSLNNPVLWYFNLTDANTTNTSVQVLPGMHLQKPPCLFCPAKLSSHEALLIQQ